MMATLFMVIAFLAVVVALLYPVFKAK